MGVSKENGTMRIVQLDFHSGVSAFTGEPFVAFYATLADGSVRQAGQMTPANAREHAGAVFQAAEAAVHDAAMAQWLRERVGMEPEKAATAVHELREFRKD